MSTAVTEASSSPPALPGTVVMDLHGRIRIPRGAPSRPPSCASPLASSTSGLSSHRRSASPTRTRRTHRPTPAGAPVTYQWTFGYDSSKGWISSGFEHSPTESYVDNNLHGPLAFIPQKLPTGVDDFMWMFALGGLGIALVLGIGANIAGWGGFAMNIVIWLSTWPPSTNPIIDAEHVTFALGLLLLMWLQASNYWGLGRWWRAHTPAILN